MRTWSETNTLFQNKMQLNCCNKHRKIQSLGHTNHSPLSICKHVVPPTWRWVPVLHQSLAVVVLQDIRCFGSPMLFHSIVSTS